MNRKKIVTKRKNNHLNGTKKVQKNKTSNKIFAKKKNDKKNNIKLIKKTNITTNTLKKKPVLIKSNIKLSEKKHEKDSKKTISQNNTIDDTKAFAIKIKI